MRPRIRYTIVLTIAAILAAVAVWRMCDYRRQDRLDGLGGRLHDAVERGDVETARHLLEMGAPMDSRIRWVREYDYVRTDLSTGHVTVEGRPIGRAIMNNDTQMIHFLLQHGCGVDDLLPAAMQYGDDDTVEFLFQHGMSPTSPVWGISPIVFALDREPEMVRFLLDQGADPNGVDWRGSPVLREAERFGHTNIMALLIEYGATTNPVRSE